MKLSLQAALRSVGVVTKLALAGSMAFSACAPSDKTVYGKESAYKSPTRKERVGTRPVQIEARLVNQKRYSVPGITIRAGAASSADASTTNSEGLVILNLQLEEDDRIDFYFSSPGGETDWTETMREVPMGVDHISVLFEQDRLGRIRIAAVEY